MVIDRQWLKDYREKAGYSQKDIAELSGVATSTYAMYEQGRRTPPVLTAARIGELLSFDWQLFFETQLHETRQLEQLA